MHLPSDSSRMKRLPTTSITPSHSHDAIPSFRLRAARFSDLSTIAQVWYEGFFDDEIIGDLMHPHRRKHPDDVYWFLLRGLRERFWDWRHQLIVVVAEEDEKNKKIVGAADWQRLGDGGKDQQLWRADPRNLVQPLLHAYHKLSLFVFPNRAADPSRSSFLTTAVADSEKHWTGDRKECWDLHVCGALPQFQGKGVGKLLVRWGVTKAKEEGVCASVLCGEKNRGFYERGGLKVHVKGNEGEEGGIMLCTR